MKCGKVSLISLRAVVLSSSLKASVPKPIENNSIPPKSEATARIDNNCTSLIPLVYERNSFTLADDNHKGIVMHS
jgi:hypothetical protein